MSKITILLDLDGTVIDSTQAILESFSIAYNKHNLQKPSDEKIVALIGHPLMVMFSELGVQKETLEEIVNSYKLHYRTIANQKTYLLPTAYDAIVKASKFSTLGVVTTKTGLYSKEILDHLGVGKYFKTIVGYENVKNHKPHQEPILKALKDLDSDKTNSWMVGDTSLDILSAQNAGIESVGVCSGYETKESLQSVTNVIESNIYDAITYIQNKYI